MILESFYYCRKNNAVPDLLPLLDGFLLDSGAFTFLQGNGGKCDWNSYVEEYADWINRYDVELFFELDIDTVIGLKEVERLRDKLETLTNKKPIPVWHKSRGLDYFLEMCERYPYVALGGIAIKEIPRQTYEKCFPWFISEAHKRGAKIHALGYTNIEGLHKYHFDSVDSTAWLYGNRGGYLYRFNPVTGTMDQYKADGEMRLKSREAAKHNFLEWNKFQRYAKRYL